MGRETVLLLTGKTEIVLAPDAMNEIFVTLTWWNPIISTRRESVSRLGDPGSILGKIVWKENISLWQISLHACCRVRQGGSLSEGQGQ